MIVFVLQAEMSDNDAVVHRIVRVCYSVHSTYFEWTIYIVEGALLCFGAFLAFETRHVRAFFFFFFFFFFQVLPFSSFSTFSCII